MMTTTPLFDTDSPSEILYNYPDTISILNVSKLGGKGYRIGMNYSQKLQPGRMASLDGGIILANEPKP